MSLNREHQVH